MISDNRESVLRDCETILSTHHDKLYNLKNEKIFITGGTGFVGTWLAEMICYLNDNHNFGTKVCLLSKKSENFKNKAPHLTKRKDITLIEKDIRDLMEIPSDVSYIIHAAANPDNKMHSSDPITVMDVISRGTNAILASAFNLSNIRKILNVSSGLIYGPQPLDLEKISENFRGGPDCDSILTVYPEAKRYAETLCTAYRNQNKLPIVTVRPFTFMGPYQSLEKPWAHTNFVRDSLLGGPIRILGNENTVRSYMYASDMAFWFLKILVDGNPGISYNVGNPEGVSLRKLAEMIASKSPANIKITSDAGMNANKSVSRFVPDVNLAKGLGLEVFTSLDEIIKRTLSWYQRCLTEK